METWTPAGGGIAACAATAIALFPEPIRQRMVAIAGAETTWTQEPGDPLSIYSDGGVSERPFSCNGASSFGAWQVNLPANHATVERLSGVASTDPCGQARWLMGAWENAGRAALAIFESQGFGAWSTYNSGAYLAHMAAAQEALAELAATPAPVKSAIGAEGVTTWVVQAGDTLSGIAAQYLPAGATQQQIAAAVAFLARYNGLADPNALSIGQPIRIPQPL